MRLPLPLVARPPRRRASARRDAPAGRGVALIFVLTTVAILTAVAVDFSYNTRVDLTLAAGSRDALRARSLAMSGMNLSRLLLRFQRQIDNVGQPLGQGLNGLLGQMPVDPTQIIAGLTQAGVNPQQMQQVLGLIQGGGAGAQVPAGAIPTLRLWDVVPINAMAAQFVGNAFKDATATRPEQDSHPTLGGEEGDRVEADFGEFTGGFSTTITDEDQKINVQRLEYSLIGGPVATLLQLSVMIDDPRYDFLFTEEDANRDRVDRLDVLAAMKDWLDADEAASGRPDLANPITPFAQGFGDENGPYSRYKRRYRAKNAKLDTLQELHQVYGVNDAFMAAFGDRLTVYPDVNNKLNLNTNDQLQMLINILTAAKNPADPLLRDPQRIALIMQQIELIKRMLPFLGISVSQFTGILEANGIQVKPEIAANSAQNVFLGDRSSTFRIVATGEAGRVKKTLTAVVRYDDGLGRLLYWHEE